ncbi:MULTISPECIES: avidin/streptavidin family protein [unclassified Bradyrhizobium]|uniref:avidin/streptavidin family protein n=1 Tax=unclassified Bradyrhizobium TaxID=2631580 RepID=UPI0028E550C4|nr:MULTISPECIES: avidin/streptavidin family protein [unclassified Bradyrhizobium]
MRLEPALSRSMPATEPLNIGGDWKNELRSEMHLDQNGATLTGHYKSYKNDAGQIAAEGPLVGWVSGKLVAFSVNWNGLDSITSWVGQHIEDQDGPRLVTLWQMTKAVPDGSEWESINAGADTFWRV